MRVDDVTQRLCWSVIYTCQLSYNYYITFESFITIRASAGASNSAKPMPVQYVRIEKYAINIIFKLKTWLSFNQPRIADDEMVKFNNIL